MKKITALFLVLLMLAASFVACTTSKNTTSALQTSTPDSFSDGFVDDYVDTDDRSDIPTIKEHVMLPQEEIPSSFTLVGTTHLPPISNQGSLGTCSSQAITYEQFTNAVSRYIHSVDKDSKWDPSSGNSSQIFAPKYTYNYSGSGTAWVYDILVHHGAATLAECRFKENASGQPSGYRDKETLSWPATDPDMMANALNYRLLDYEQIWANSIGNQLTTTEAGQNLLYKIKDAVVQGNVVVTGGISGGWRYDRLSAEEAKSSEMAKENDQVLVRAVSGSGGHQISIVGFDDNLTIEHEGVTMKGAFLCANSWGTQWANDGYFWIMYDSANSVSEYEELNKPDRFISLDQYCFIYWEKDIVIEKPAAYLTVEMEISNREGFYIELTRTDMTDTTISYLPNLFNYGSNFLGTHPSELRDGEMYVNFNGEIDGGKAVGYITLGYNPLIPNGKKFEDYIWGAKIYATDEKVTLRKITLYDGTGKAHATIAPAKELEIIKAGDSQSYFFDMGNTLVSAHNIGSYKLKNTESGLYCGYNYLLIESTEQVNDAGVFEVDFDYLNRTHTIKMKDKDYVLDIKGKTVADGVTVKYNAENFTRNTQTWKVVELDDGTFNIRLANDTRYAMGMVDGEIVLVSGADIQKYGTWIFENAGSADMYATVRYNAEGKLMIAGSIPESVQENTLNATAYTGDGAVAGSYALTGSGELRTFEKEVTDLAAGNYLFVFTNEKGDISSGHYYVVVK